MKSNKFLVLAVVSIILVLLPSCGSQKLSITSLDTTHPKREFRGAWLSTAWQARYKTMNSTQMKTYFTESLDKLQAAGINAVIFQVRPQADAFYKSNYEPWSAHLTGTQGVAPDGNFDPLAFLIDECHQRGMELHAWLNPYRVTTSANEKLVSDHIYYQEPDRFVTYDNKIYFDPGIPKNRTYVQKIVKDILFNYNVDAIHMDDYFYPYPVAGQEFPDQNSYATYGDNYPGSNVKDWRRKNVNLLIKEVKETIQGIKPWVRFGISPFGIYRNKKSDSGGSDTNGLQNYDDLYADIKLWVENGWIDYNMPQLYWEIGHKTADYETLLNWWSANNFEQPLFIGQDVKRTMDAKYNDAESQLDRKIDLTRMSKNVSGNCFWPAYELLDNYKGSAADLKKYYHRFPALVPAYTHMHSKAPKRVGKITTEYTATQRVMKWKSDAEEYNPESAQYYVVYRFAKGEKEVIEDPRNIVAITNKTELVLPYEGGKTEYRYVITAIDSFHNESKGKSKKIKL